MGALLLVAALLRVSAMFYASLSGDDATVALMAKHVLSGEDFPVFFYREAFMGALNGFHLVPALFLFGPSALLVRLNAIAYSLVFPLGLYLVGRRVFDEAAARAVLVLAALPPFLLTYWSTVAEPHFETNSFGVVLVLLALAAVDARSEPRYARILACFGFTAGLAFWTSYKVIEVLLPALLVLWLHDPRLPLRRGAWLLGGGFVLGSLPAWLFYGLHGDPGADTPGAAGRMLQAGLDLSAGRLAEFLATVPPTMLGSYYWSVKTLARRAALLANITVYVAATAAVFGGALARRARRQALTGREWGTWLLLLMLGAPFAMLYVSGFGGDLSHESARYTLPAYIPLLLFAGALVARLWRRWRWAGAGLLALLVAFDLWTNVAFLWPLHRAMRADGAAERAQTQAIARQLRTDGVRALYLDSAYGSLRWAFLLPIPVSELTNDIYAPGVGAADAAADIAMLRERPEDTVRDQLRMLGATFRVRPYRGVALFHDIHVPARAYRLVPRAGWRVRDAGDGPPPLADGDLGTAWPPGQPTEGAPDGVVVDLGTAVRVGRIVWWPWPASVDTPPLAVGVSVDGARWDQVGVAPSLAGRPAFVAGGRPVFRPRDGWLEARVAPRPVRYVRFAPADPAVRGGWAVAELFVYADAGPAVTESADPAVVAARLRADGLTRLLADPVTSARVARLMQDRITILPTNGVLDSHGRAFPPARLADWVQLRPTDGLLVPAEDAADLEARLRAAGLGVQAEALGTHVLAHLPASPVPLEPCRRTRAWHVETREPTPDGKGARYVVEARLQEPQRVLALRLEHPAVSVRHIPAPVVSVSDDGRTWRRADGVRRVPEWAWGGRTLLEFSQGMEELVAAAPVPAAWVRVELVLPYRGVRPITSICVRGA